MLAEISGGHELQGKHQHISYSGAPLKVLQARAKPEGRGAFVLLPLSAANACMVKACAAELTGP